MKRFLVILIFFYSLNGSGQGENNNWYFGINAGLDFNSGSPVPIIGGQIHQWEGVASISDAAGSLLFYTDGDTIWDRTYNFMTNGTGLHGGWSSTQSATIVPMPGVPTQFYVFTCTANFGSLEYSIVDMSLNGGYGDVTAVKNVVLEDSMTEQCTVIHAANGYLWLVARKFSPRFFAWLIDTSGIQSPVISYCGSLLDWQLAQGVGYMKSSSLSDKIGVAYYASSSVNSYFELYDFDNASGVVSNAFQLTSGTANVYACEFSPDGSKFYGALWGNTNYQFDLNAGSPAAIQASKIIIANPGGYTGAMQIGPDQKIYITTQSLDKLSVIDNPNDLGLACNFQIQVVSLGGNISGIGLPGKILLPINNTFPNASFFTPNHICPGTCTDFTNYSTNATSFTWNFQGGSPSVSTEMNPVNICYSTPGQYDVTLIATSNYGSDTLYLDNFITVYQYPSPQGIIQSGDTLFANGGAQSYQWYQDGNLIPGATESYYVASASGDFNIVAADNNGCEVEAAIFDVIAGLTPALSKGEGVSVFPNPVNESLSVTGYPPALLTSGSAALPGTADQISIYNMLGEKVMDILPGLFERQGGKIDVSDLQHGMYWLSFVGNKSIVRIPFTKI
jgi:PKD repeat protein